MYFIDSAQAGIKNPKTTLERNMTKTKKIIIGTIISAVTLGGVAAYASPDGCGGKHRGGMMHKGGDFIAKRLNLDETQKQNLENLRKTMREQMEANHADTKPREEISALLSEPTLDQTKLLALMEERATKMKASAPTVVAAIATFTNSLSNEQRADMQAMMKKFGERRKGRMKGGMGKPFGFLFGGRPMDGQHPDDKPE